MNKKGVESFPFFLFLSLLIAAFVITIGFNQLKSINEFSEKKDILEGYKNMINSMNNLRATSDFGSFTRVKLKIPEGYKISIFPQNNTIEITTPSKTLTNNVEFNIIAVTDGNKAIHYDSYTFNPGEYEIVIYYGNITQAKEYEIFFE
ncbi:MAG: hypothetical protein J7K22_03160 [Nanoarchaeota archaeon]|nr:hypothetical protein [Nanoarchaeota archaeon]